MAQILRPPCEDRPFGAHTETADCATRNRPFVLAATILGSSMAFIDGSALTVALPALRADFDAGFAEVQWVVNAYVLSLAAFALIGGSLADRIGRRAVFNAGCAVFAFASLACALAPSLGLLTVARFAQGIGAALLTPASLALLSSVYPKAERGAAIGAWAAASAITAAGGPVLGGWLTERFGWPSIFFLNLPLAVVAVALALRYAPDARAVETVKRSLDWTGAALAAAGFGLAAFGLVALGEGRGTGGPSPALLLGAGVAMLALFALWETRTEAPMTPPALFASAAFSGLNLATLLMYAALSVMFFLLPFDLIERRGYTATEAGLALLPFSLLVGILSRWIGGLADRAGPRGPLTLGAIASTTGYGLIAFAPADGGYWTSVFPGMAALGLGFAIVVAPLTSAVLSVVDEEEQGTASGVNNTASRVAQLLGVAGAAALAAGLQAPMPVAMALCAALTLAAAAVFATTAPRRTSPAA